MPNELVLDFWEAIEVIEAQNHLALMKIADFPNLKQAERTKVHKEVYKRAYPFQKKKSVTWEELQRIMRG